MFEGHSPTDLDALLHSDREFRQLYHLHRELDRKVQAADLGVLPIDELRLVQMKKEKLQAKDRLVGLYAQRY